MREPDVWEQLDRRQRDGVEAPGPASRSRYATTRLACAGTVENHQRPAVECWIQQRSSRSMSFAHSSDAAIRRHARGSPTQHVGVLNLELQ